MTLHDLCRALGVPHSPTTRTLGPSAWDGRRLHGWRFRTAAYVDHALREAA